MRLWMEDGLRLHRAESQSEPDLDRFKCRYYDIQVLTVGVFWLFCAKSARALYGTTDQSEQPENMTSVNILLTSSCLSL